MVCPCALDNKEGDEPYIPSFVMEQSIRNITFNCKNPDCHNFFDYDIKVRLVELLNEYYRTHGTLEGFFKYVERKKERVRLRFITETNKTKQNPSIIIEVANISRCPHYKL